MKKLFFILSMILCICVLSACGNTEGQNPDSSTPDNDSLKVAFVYNGVAGDYGWIYGHEKARQETQAALDFVETMYMENVAPGADAERIISDLAAEGYDVIIAVSADFEADVRKVAPNTPDTYYLICAGSYVDTNVESFYPKTYEVWWLLGKLAAMLPDVDTIGMVGSVVTPTDLQIQNAFILGARSINPEIQERIIYINSYYDPAAERDAALSLLDAGVDVLAQSTNTPAHVQAAEENEVFSMSQYEDMRQFGPNYYVSGESLNWSAYYIPVLTQIYEGTFVPTYSTPDFTTGTMSLIEFGPMVTDEITAAIKEAEEELLANPNIIWQGPIYDNNGNMIIDEGEVLTQEQLTSMNWWAHGTVTAGGE